MSTQLNCQHSDNCNGCDYWKASYEEQKQIKLNDLINTFKEKTLKLDDSLIEFHSIKEFGLRHRFDFTIQNINSTQVTGLYNKRVAISAETKPELIQISECLQLSPELQKAYTDFLKFQIFQTTDTHLFKKGSVRLRVGPTGLKGCWLDLANLDIKFLLSDGRYLNELLQAGFHIEIGQKGKALKSINGVLKLQDPESHDWFSTIDNKKNTLNLNGLVSDFTQPSWLSAHKLVDLILLWIQEYSSTSLNKNYVAEFGPGLGQFTLPLLSLNSFVDVFEFNESATLHLQLNAKKHKLESKLKIHLGDFQNRALTEEKKYDFALVNPPRSGLKKFVQTLIKMQPQYCIYVSCFPESMAEDLSQLTSAGYQIKKIALVDQFPQTKHYEACVLIEKN